MTVNGVVSPYHRVARGLYRLRVLDASNYRSYRLFFSNEMPFWVLGNDGGMLDTAVTTTSVLLTAGERVDLVVDFSGLAKDEYVELTNDRREPEFIRLNTGAEPLPHLVRFIGTGVAGHRQRLPERLRGAAGRPPLLPRLGTPDRTRVVTLSQHGDLSRWPPAGMSLNNLDFTDPDIETPAQGTTELWEVVNATLEDHPVHLHLVNMLLVNRQRFNLAAYVLAHPPGPKGTRWAPPPDRFLVGPTEAPQPWEAGPKDTVNCPANTVTRFLVRFPTAHELGFDPDAPFAPAPSQHSHHGSGQHAPLQGYVWHCQALDYEDDCMMARYRLVRGG